MKKGLSPLTGKDTDVVAVSTIQDVIHQLGLRLEALIDVQVYSAHQVVPATRRIVDSVNVVKHFRLVWNGDFQKFS